MRKSLLMVSLAACCAFVLSSSVALAADNWLGTWKLDLAKSKYSPGPAPKSLTLKYEAMSDGIKFTGDGVGADGKPTHTMFLSKFDGKDVPYEGNPDADTASPRRSRQQFTRTPGERRKATTTSNVVVSGTARR